MQSSGIPNSVRTVVIVRGLGGAERARLLRQVAEGHCATVVRKPVDGAGDGRRVAGRATDRVQQQARQQGSRHGGIDFCR